MAKRSHKKGSAKGRGFQGSAAPKKSKNGLILGLGVGVIVLALLGFGMFQLGSGSSSSAAAPLDGETQYLGLDSDPDKLLLAEAGSLGKPTLVFFHADW